MVVYDILGRVVAQPLDEPRSAGTHRVRLNAAGLASGIYVVHLTAESQAATQRVVLTK